MTRIEAVILAAFVIIVCMVTIVPSCTSYKTYDSNNLEKYKGASTDEWLAIYEYCASNPMRDLTRNPDGTQKQWK